MARHHNGPVVNWFLSRLQGIWLKQEQATAHLHFTVRWEQLILPSSKHAAKPRKITSPNLRKWQHKNRILSVHSPVAYISSAMVQIKFFCNRPYPDLKSQGMPIGFVNLLARGWECKNWIFYCVCSLDFNKSYIYSNEHTVWWKRYWPARNRLRTWVWRVWDAGFPP